MKKLFISALVICAIVLIGDVLSQIYFNRGFILYETVDRFYMAGHMHWSNTREEWVWHPHGPINVYTGEKPYFECPSDDNYGDMRDTVRLMVVRVGRFTGVGWQDYYD